MENRMEKLEAISTLIGFNERLLKNLPTIIQELNGNRKPDTDNYLSTILSVINWEVNVVNATMDLLNENLIRVNKEPFNEKITALSLALSQKQDALIAAAFEELIPVFEELGVAAKEVAA